MLVELVEGFYVNPKLVAVVKETAEDECALFTPGQSAVDGGFKLNYRAADVADALTDFDEEEEPDEDEEEDEDGGDEEKTDD